MLMKKENDLPVFKRYIMPTAAIIGSLFMIVAACFSHRLAVVAYLIVCAVIMTIGAVYSKEKRTGELTLRDSADELNKKDVNI